LIKKRQFRARIGAGPDSRSFANGIVHGGGSGYGLPGEQADIMDHFGNVGLFLVGCKKETGNTGGGSD